MTSSTSTWAAKAERLNALKRPTQPFTICEDPAVRERLAEAKTEAKQAADLLEGMDTDADPATRSVYTARAKRAKAALTAAQKAFDAVSVMLTFTALERSALDDLRAKHPASEEQEADGKEFADTFFPELISAASLDGMPVADARRYLDTWSEADALGLWRAAWSVQQIRRTDLGKG